MAKPGQWIFKVPDELPDELVAPANCALSQVLYSLHRIGVWLGDTVADPGRRAAWGCAPAAVAKEMGAGQVIVVDRIAERLALAREFGADATIDLTELPDPADRVRFVQERTEGRGADVALEVAGVPAVVQEGLDLLRFGGRYCLVGNIVAGGQGGGRPARHRAHVARGAGRGRLRGVGAPPGARLPPAHQREVPLPQARLPPLPAGGDQPRLRGGRLGPLRRATSPAPPSSPDWTRARAGREAGAVHGPVRVRRASVSPPG